MQRSRVLIAGSALAVMALSAGIFVTSRVPDMETDPAPASAPATVAQAPSTVAIRPRAGRVVSVADAVKDLDLIRPARQKLAEDFTRPMPDGSRFRLSEHRGKVVFINFWATWCPPCLEEMPAMEKLYRQQRDNGFVMVAVSVDADSGVVPPFLRKVGLTMPVALDPGLEVANTYGVRALPSSFIVDRNGYLAALALGPRDWNADAAHSLVEGLARR